MKPREIDVRIDELVLHGFRASDRLRIGAALERELARLFTERGVPPSLTRSGQIVSLDAGQFEVPSSARAEGVGARAAHQVHRGLSEGFAMCPTNRPQGGDS